MKKEKVLACLMTVAMLALTTTGCGVVQNEPAASPQSGGASSTSSDAQPAAQTAEQLSGTPAALEGADVVIKIAHSDTDVSLFNVWNCYSQTLKNSLEAYSGGTMTCDIYPNDQLGDLTSQIEQVSSGSLDMTVSFGSGNLQSWLPNVSIWDIPYEIDDLDALALTLEGPILREYSQELESKANMKLVAMMPINWRNLDTWGFQARTPDDLKGKKLRIQEIEAQIAMVEAWGAVPTTVSFSELYSAASTGVIDAFENANNTLFMKNLQEVVDYITDTQHLPNVCCAAMSTKTWESLTPEQQAVFERAARDARKATLGAATINEINNNIKLRESNTELIALTQEEREAFKDACYEQAKEKVMQNIDPAFYEHFRAEYEAAKETLGID